jgi:hypothetical protein
MKNKKNFLIEGKEIKFKIINIINQVFIHILL